MDKEEVLKKFEKLREEYEYWFEVFRREKDPKKKEEAKKEFYNYYCVLRYQDFSTCLF